MDAQLSAAFWVVMGGGVGAGLLRGFADVLHEYYLGRARLLTVQQRSIEPPSSGA